MFFADSMSLDTSDNEYNDTDDDDVGVLGHGWEKLGTELKWDKHHENELNYPAAESESPAVLKQRITMNEKQRNSAALQSPVALSDPSTVCRRRIGSQSTRARRSIYETASKQYNVDNVSIFGYAILIHSPTAVSLCPLLTLSANINT